MKAYVIKNKEGKMLCWHHVVGYYFDHFNIKSMFYMELGTKKEIKMVFKNKEFDNTDCTIVPITIYEGDLEEKYEVLQGVIHLAMDYACRDKKLYKRIQDFNVSTNRHNGDNNVYLEDAVCFLTKLSKDARDEAKKWGEFFEKVYQEQQAKESKDE